MTVGELRKLLASYDDDLDVITKKTEMMGNCAWVNSVRKDTYALFGVDIPCVILTDEFESEE